MIEKIVKLPNLEVTVRELTFGEVRDLLVMSQAKADGKDLDFFLDGMIGVGMWEVSHFTSLTKEQVSKLTPSDLDSVMAVVREVNQAFFKQRDALMAVASRMLSAT